VPARICAAAEEPASASTWCNVNHHTPPPLHPELVLRTSSCSWGELRSVRHLWERQSSLAKSPLCLSTSKPL